MDSDIFVSHFLWNYIYSLYGKMIVGSKLLIIQYYQCDIFTIRGDSMTNIFKFRLQNIKKCSKISQINTCGCVFIDATKYLRQFLHYDILETCPIEIKLKVKDNNRYVNNPRNFQQNQTEATTPGSKHIE